MARFAHSEPSQPVCAPRSTLLAALLLAAVLLLGAPQHARAQTIIYVNAAAAPGGNGQSWGTAYHDLQLALDNAELEPLETRDVEVWIAAGVYVPSRLEQPGQPRSASFSLPHKTMLFGGFRGDEVSAAMRDWNLNQSVLSGDLLGNDPATGELGAWSEDNACNIVLAHGADQTMALDGLWFIGGNAMTGEGRTSDRGGAITSVTMSDLYVRHCTFVSNFAKFGGAVYSNSATAVFDSCRFLGNQSSAQGGAVVIGSLLPAPTVFRGCYFSGNIATQVEDDRFGGGAMHVFGNVHIAQCTFSHNSSLGPGAAVYSFGSEGLITIDNSLFTSNTSLNVVSDFGYNVSPNITASYCAFEANPGVSGPGSVLGVITLIQPAGPDGVIGTADDDGRLCGNSAGVDAGSNDLVPPDMPFDLGGNPRVLDGNADGVETVDAGAFEFAAATVRRYVRESGGGNGDSWSTASPSLADTLQITGGADCLGVVREIWVAAGTYTPSLPLSQGGSRSASFQLQNGLAIYGGFAGNETELSQRDIAANPTILSGDLNGDDSGDLNRGDNTFHVVMSRVDNVVAHLDGLTISDGSAHGDPMGETRGAGLDFRNGTLSVRNCRFLDNSSPNAGGAVNLVDPHAPTEFIDCEFIRNTAFDGTSNGEGGAVLVNGSNANNRPRFERCRFEGNSSNLASAVWASYSTFVDCDFVRNRSVIGSAGLYTVFASQCSFINCRVLGNTTNHPTASVNSDGPFIGCSFVGNRSTVTSGDYSGFQTGAAHTSGGVVANCIFVDNSAAAPSVQCAGLALTGTLPVVNSIFWNNSTPSGSGEIAQLKVFQFSTINLRANTIMGWDGSLGGVGNNGLDPRFRRMPSPGPDGVWGTIDDDYGDLRLTNGSPAIDSGDSTAVPPDTFDIDGNGNTTESLPWDLDGLSRFVDDPLVANTGFGSPPVDRGCYEFVPPVVTQPGDRRWVSPAGGDFNSLFNWFPAVPGAQDNAVFDIPSAYTVDFAASPPRQTLTARVSRGHPTFDLNGSTYSITSASQPALVVGDEPGVAAMLTITDGTVAPFSARIGAEPGSAGVVAVSGSGARLTIAQDDLSVGFFGQGHMVVNEGGRVVSRTAGVGDQPGSEGSTAVVTGAGSTWSIPFFLAINNGSVTVSDGGTLTAGFGVFLFQNGTISGDGTIDADVVNFGTIAPGNSPGALTITGDYEQVGVIPELGANSGRLRAQVAGTATGDYDQLIVNGTATLGGGLFVEFVDGYTPQPDQLGDYPTFRLLESSSVLTSRFDVAFFPPVPQAQGQGAKYLRAVYPNRGPGTVELIFETLGANPDFDDPNTLLLDGGPTAAAVGDLNEDGLPDLAVALPDVGDPEGAPGSVLVLYNAGTIEGVWQGFGAGSVVQYAVGRNPSGVAIGDFDGVNGNDLAVSNQNSNSVTILPQAALPITTPRFAVGGTALTIPTGNEPTAVAAFNLDRAGRIDLAVANGADNTVMMMANSNNPEMAGFVVAQIVPVGVRPVAIRPFNPDNDKDVDVAVVNQGSASLSIMVNQGFGSFGTPLTINVGMEPSALVAGSLLNREELDRRQDLVVVNRGGGSVSIVVNTTPVGQTDALIFAPAVESVLATSNPDGSQPRSVAMVDLDGDGDLDVAVLARDSEDTATAVRLLRNDLNDGDQLAFVESAELNAGLAPIAVLTADVDGDGQPDLITVSGGLRGPGSGTVSVLRNAFAPPPPPCRADFDGNGLVQVPDIFAFLAAWFAQAAGSDFDGNGTTAVPDIFAFLAAWFAGCP